MSVAVANPTITTDDNTADISSSLGITWENATNGGFSPSFADADSATHFIISFAPNTTENATAIEGSGGTTYVVKIADSLSSVTLTSTQTLDMTGKSIELRPSKNGTVTGKITTLDLSGVTSGYALKGDFKTGGGAGNTNIGKFGGDGIQGNVAFDGSASTEMYFTGNAGITGTLGITQNGTNTFWFGSGTIGGVTTISNGQNTFKLQSSSADGATINSLFANTVSLSGGSLIFAFADGTTTDNKIFNLNTAKQITITNADSQQTTQNQFSITGGTLVFNGAKKVYFNSGDTVNQGDSTLTLNRGSVKFIVDPTIISANQTNQAIAKGSISATNASVIFTLSDYTDATGSNPFTDATATAPTDTYYVDGSITINNGGISAFWDDEKGFVAKVATTGTNHSMTFTGGLSGKNNVWFNSGTFSSGSNVITKIRTSGVSHIVFEDSMVIGNQNDASSSGNNATIRSSGGQGIQVLFKNDATIYGQYEGENPTAPKKTALFATGSGNNLLIFKGETTIEGDIYAIFTTSGSYGQSINTLTFEGNATINGEIVGAGSDYGNAEKNNTNNLTFKGAINALKNISATSTAYGGKGLNTISFIGSNQTNTIAGNITANTGKNVVSFDNTSGSNTITGNITATSGKNEVSFLNGNSQIQGLISSSNAGNANVISFAGAGTASISLPSSQGSGTSQNVISTSAGENTITFSNSGTQNISGNISSTSSGGGGYGNNTISFNSVSEKKIQGNVSGNIGKNNISFSGDGNNTITGNVSIEGRSDTPDAINTITFSGGGTASIGGGSGNVINAVAGKNEVTFSNTGSQLINGNISSQTSSFAGTGNNTISFNSASEKKINGNISGNLGNNTIAFSGDGNNIITGKVSNTEGVASITFSGGGTASIGGGSGNAIESAGEAQTAGDKGTTITFSNSGTQTINGSVSAGTTQYGGTGENIISFNSANEKTIQGGVSGELGKNNITFSGNGNNTIAGNVSITGNGASSPTNTIRFNGGGNAIFGDGTGTALSASAGENTITFSNSGTQIINGSIYSGSTGTGGQGNNIVSFNSASEKKIQGGVSGNLGNNTITFSGSGNNTITGNVSIEGRAGSTDLKNIITFNGSGNSSLGNGSGNALSATATTNEITFSNSGTQTINGSISAGVSVSGGTGYNIVSFTSGSGDSTITGGISATSSTNRITFTNTSGFIGGNISNNAGTNTIDAGNNALKLGVDGTRVSISASGGATARNQITAGAITAYITSMTAGDHSNGNNTNTLTGGAGSNLAIGTMSATQNANSYNAISVGENSSILVTGGITSNVGKNNFAFTGGNSTLTLQGQTSQISTLTAVSGNATNKDTLILDTTNNANATSIDKVVNGANLIVSMKGNATNSATLTLNNSSADSTIKTLNLTETASGVDKNILNLQARTTTILDEINIASGKGLTINLNGTSTTLELDNGLSNSGSAKINIADNNNAIIGGNVITSSGGNTQAVFVGTGSLTLKGANNSFSLLDVSNGASTLSLNSSNVSTTTIAQLKGSNLTANFGGTDKATKLVIADSDASNKQVTLAGVTLENNSTNNTLDLTSLSSATISNAVSVDSGKGLTIALGSTDMTFTNGLSGNSVLSVSGTSSFTTTSNDIEASSLNLVGDGSAKATFKNATTTLSTLNANAKGGNTLALGESGGNTYTLTIGSTNANLTELSLNGASATININGGTQSLQTLSTNATTTNALNLSGTKTTISSSLNADGSKTLNLTLTNSTLSLGGENNKISSLVASGSNTLVDLARVDSEGNALTRAGRAMKTLEIGANSGSGFKGDATFEVYVGGGQADKVVFSAVEQNNGEKSNATLVASGGLYGVLNGGGTLLASVADSEKDEIVISGGERLIGGVVVKTELEEKAENGNTNYYLKQGEDLGAPIQYQEVASSALTVNYDLFLANFNSLNKRMGELRDDANSNGVWARVFGGAMSNDFGAGSKTEYITAQAGYDYALSVGNNARNHLGIAVAYGTSNTQGNTLSMNGLLGSSGSISLNEVDSNMVEVGIYNTFISDSGWYNDTIFKFDYIMSKFSLSNKTDLFTDTSNFAMVLSDEFGYRYSFGENEKGSWYIDPQAEVAFGYFNQSDFNRAMYDSVGLYQSTMQATQDTILTLRTRVGASLGKKFNTEKGFASLYVGAFYEYDYINGGNASVQGRAGGTTISLDSLESNGRAVLNVGSNIELTKGARLYIDVEKSFGDKQRTFMQFNLGARYSF